MSKKPDHWFIHLGVDFYIHTLKNDDIFHVEENVYKELKAMSDPGAIEAVLNEHE